MDRRAELVRDEELAWDEFCELVNGFTPDQMLEPGVTPEGWSVKDLVFHVGCWLADCAMHLERMRLGTFTEPDIDDAETDRINREWFERARDLDLPTVRCELAAGRTRMLQEFGWLDVPTASAIEWFEESGPLHYREHAADLRAWKERLEAARGE